ncbi:MAG: XrtA/PEP-CTERM system TPR-repeat protein PrsT [Rubrivivax sp.]
MLQARLKAAEGDFPGALVLLDGVLVQEPGRQDAGIFKGEVLWFGQDDREAALAAFKKVLESNPRSVAAHTSAIALLNEQGQRNAARAQFAELGKIAPRHPDTAFLEAQFAFADGEFRKSRELTARLLKVMPDNARVLELAGAADFQLGRFAEAEVSLARALKNAPGRLMSRHLLAQTHLRLNQPGRAVSALAPVVEGPSPDGTSLTLAGEAYLLLGDNRRADAAYAAAARAAPKDTRVRTSIALADMARGNTGAAIAKLESVAAEDKGTRADIALVSARMRANDLPGALKAIDSIQQKVPEAALSYHLRGRVQLMQRRIPAATQSFETALAKEPGFYPAIASLAAIDLGAGKPEAARRRFEDHAKADPKSHLAHLSLAELAQRTGAEPAAVLQHLRNAVRANAGEVQPHLLLVRQLLGAGDSSAALTAAREGAAALPSNPDMKEALGRAQLAVKDAASAVATFKQLTAQHETNPQYQVRLAEALLETQAYAAARRTLEDTLKAHPGFTSARRALMTVAMRQDKPQEAIALAREIQKSEPRDPGGFLLEGDVETVRRNHDLAAAAYRKALELGKVTDIAMRLHMALLAAGRPAEADKVAADWSRANPKDAVFRFYEGDVALERGDLAAAEGHYRVVLAEQPRNAIAMNNMAYLLIKQGKTGALDLARQANALLPGRPQMMDTLALALAADKKLPQAIEVQKAAILRAPNDPGLKLTLARLLIQSGDKSFARAELEDLAKLGSRFRDQAEVAKLLATL